MLYLVVLHSIRISRWWRIRIAAIRRGLLSSSSWHRAWWRSCGFWLWLWLWCWCWCRHLCCLAWLLARKGIDGAWLLAWELAVWRYCAVASYWCSMHEVDDSFFILYWFVAWIGVGWYYVLEAHLVSKVALEKYSESKSYPWVKKTWQITESAERDVNERISTAEAALHPYYE